MDLPLTVKFVLGNSMGHRSLPSFCYVSPVSVVTSLHKASFNRDKVKGEVGTKGEVADFRVSRNPQVRGSTDKPLPK